MEWERHDMADVLVSFARRLADDQSANAVLQALGDFCTEVIGFDCIGVLLLEDGDLVVATTNSPLGEQAEALEVEFEEGPCASCVRHGLHVAEPDIAAAIERYPRFAPRAMEVGIAAVHAVPLSSRSDVLGALNIVNGTPRDLTAEELSLAEMLCDVAVSYLISIKAHEQANATASQLQHALDSRILIEQAKGRLVERHRISFDEAFERLRSHARGVNHELREVARRVRDGDIDV